MGIPGILKEIGRGERIALSKLAIEHLERTRRPLRIAIDAAIWNFQNQAAKGGRNPNLRTLFYRLLRLLALPIHPVFVYDGKNKPLTKRGKTVSAYGTCIPNEMSKKLVQLFRYPHHTAPGEAEAECAFLQKHGVVDAVMSQDVDAIMFGSGVTLRNWTKEATRGNKVPTHVDVLRSSEVKNESGLTPEGLILVALLSGGDYDSDGVPGFGATLACEIAKAGFGEELLDLIVRDDADGLQEWRERLEIELETNESGYFKVKRRTLRLPADFPNRTILRYYTNPTVSPKSELPHLRKKWEHAWDQEIDLIALRQYVADKFDWLYDTGAKKLTRCLAPSLLAQQLQRGLLSESVFGLEQITERRTHFVNDGMPELRLKVIPGDIVGLDLSSEQKNPGWATEEAVQDDEEELMDNQPLADEDPSAPPRPLQKLRKSPPWDPTVAEKMWIPETIVQLGVPALVEAWQQKQRDILADPVSFANRKAKTKAQLNVRDTGMKAGAIDSYFGASKPAGGQSREVSTKAIGRTPPHNIGKRLQKRVETTPTKPPRKQQEKNNRNAQVRSPILTPQRNRVISSFLQELQSVGKGSQDCVIINSSPTVASPHATQEAEEAAIISDGEFDSRAEALHAASAMITQRKRTLPRAKIFTTSPSRIAALKSPTKAVVPIESFFGVAKTGVVREAKTASKPISADAVKPALPPALSLGLRADLIAARKFAIPRDSLPGTWKEIDTSLVDVSLSPPSDRRSRLSYIDLDNG